MIPSIHLQRVFKSFPRKLLNGMKTTGKFTQEFSTQVTVSLVIAVVSQVFHLALAPPFWVYSLSGIACRSVLILTDQYAIDLFGSHKQEAAHLIDTCFFVPLLVSITFFVVYPLWPSGVVPLGVFAGASTEFLHQIACTRKKQQKETFS